MLSRASNASRVVYGGQLNKTSFKSGVGVILPSMSDNERKERLIWAKESDSFLVAYALSQLAGFPDTKSSEDVLKGRLTVKQLKGNVRAKSAGITHQDSPTSPSPDELALIKNDIEVNKLGKRLFAITYNPELVREDLVKGKLVEAKLKELISKRPLKERLIHRIKNLLG